MKNYSIVTYFSGGDFNMDILRQDCDVVVFTPKEYSGYIRDITQDHKGILTIVNYNVELMFPDFIKELSQHIEEPIEYLENILASHYVSVALENKMCLHENIAFIRQDFHCNFACEQFSDGKLLEDGKIYIDIRREYDDTFMDAIIKEKRASEYLSGSLILAKKDSWDVLTGLISQAETNARIRNLVATMDDLLLISFINMPNQFRKIDWIPVYGGIE